MTAPENPPLPYCDLIMKGGITSGVIYPRLIAGLAARYRFKNIGGSSAGAIAAAGCAAAEFRRLRGDDGGFSKLAELPGDLGRSPPKGEGSTLRHLFQPSAALSRHFDVLLAALNQPSKGAIAFQVLGALLLRYWGIAVLVALPTLALVVALLRSAGPLGWGVAALTAAAGSALWLAALGWIAARAARQDMTAKLPGRLAWGWLGGVVLAGLALGALTAGWHGATLLAALSWGLVLPLSLAVALALCGWRFASTLLRGLQANFWGVCSGLSTGERAPVPGLTVWLGAYFNELAGLDAAARPLTLGDLWSGDRTLGDDARDGPDAEAIDRKINLEVMTTAITRQMPYALPFRPGADAYHFDPEEWRHLFAPAVMDWLLKASPLPADGSSLRTQDGRPLRRLPCNRHLPVVLLVRMSLSFPVLLSAVPLYAVDYSGKTQSAFAKKVWFSDGGIASNMPLHFFDAPLPAHPTFAVNLKDEHPDHPIGADAPACAPDNGRVYLPSDNRGGLKQYWKTPDDSSPWGLFPLLWSMVETMHNWRDAIQLPMPGNRDRVVQIMQRPGEGGLNLDMPTGHIDALGEAGACAAERLIDRFSPAAGATASAGWDNHRRQRMRTFAALAEMLGRHPEIHAQHWRELLQDELMGYTQEERDRALRVLDSLAAIGSPVQRESELVLIDKAPKPRPVWRIVPRI